MFGHSKVDPDTYEWASTHRWTIIAKGYVSRGEWNGGNPRAILLHRVIMGIDTGDPLTVDHINRDKLDNRRENLRIIPKAGQAQNRGKTASPSSSQYRGVHFCNRTQKWVAKTAGKTLGYFTNEEEAAAVALAYRLATMEFATD